MALIEQKLTNAIAAKGDISDHLIYLMKLSSKCSSILECGTRTIVTSWAFVNGLSINSVNDKKNITVSHFQTPPTIHELQDACSKNNIEFEYSVNSTNETNIIIELYKKKIE